MSAIIDLLSKASKFPMEYILALIALAAMGLAAFAIHAIHSIAKQKGEK